MAPFIISQNLTSFDDYIDQKDGLSVPMDHFSEHHHASTLLHEAIHDGSQLAEEDLGQT